MKFFMLTVVALTTTYVGVSPCLASNASKPAATKYSSKHIRFTYPSGWSKLPSSDLSTFAASLSRSAGGYVSVAALAGVWKVNSKTNHAGVAVLAKMNFTKKFQKNLKGNRKLFIKKFEQGASASAKKVLSKGHARFAGQNADEIQVLLVSNGSESHDQFFLAIAPNGKSVDMAVMLAIPSKTWSTYSSALSGIAASSSFR